MQRRTFLAAGAAGLLAGCASLPDLPVVGGSGHSPTPAGTGTDTPAITPSATPTPGPAGPPLGFSLSPRSYGNDDFTSFLERAAAVGSLVRWAGDWAALSEPTGGPAVVADLSDQYGYDAVVDTGVYSVDERALFAGLDAATRDAFVAAVAGFAAEHGPAALGLGVEVNVHASEDRDSFERYVALFDRAAEAVADRAPETIVTVAFQYEWLRGLRGGLFGGENDPGQAQWELLERFPAADQVAITTYPGLVYDDPADVPADHYAPLADRVDRPVAVTEVGWTSETVAEGWESSEAEQAAFVRRLFDLLAPLDPTQVVWPFMYEPGGLPRAFQGMALRREDGSAKPAWDAWVARGEG